ncbi:hypothetical protein HAP48_0049300 (plasmid) [Bradyrhizobium septentrionale]|uniref:Uncharacterized protein n=1 Tax=Bradyrhizobium septentrionale TaxID=1404411 RepID=A0A973WAW9_9BRAD|nr:hypothetical protein [Bradyrhizobium septentrionale]UGY20960.1 hypothetical protein HAP48_0049300 [Bradyrhizobium septentrionale]
MPTPATEQQKWLDEVRRALEFAEENVGADIVATRNALYALWRAMDGAPGTTRDLFRRFDEDTLVADAAGLSTNGLFSGIPLTAANQLQRKELLYALAVRLRCVEDLLHEMMDGVPIRSEAQCLATYEGREGFVLLRQPRHRIAKTRQTFRKRGLRRSSIFPLNIGDYRVKPLFFEDPRARDRMIAQRDLSLGAGLFEGLSFDLGHDAGGFFVKGVTAGNQIDVIRDDLASASNSGCDGVVYPELTVTRETLGEIETRIGGGDWRSDLSFLVPGSLHEEVGGQRFNICSILNGYGGKIGEHRKLFQFTDGANDAESIELGIELPVLILPDATIAFGICLDYCVSGEDPPYEDLDVDYFLVPSCGNGTTMEGHIDRSKKYVDVRKTRTLVVQQFFDERCVGDPPIGYVLCRRDDTRLTVPQTEMRIRWGIYNI